MRLFQNSGLYPAYRRYFDSRFGTRQDFAARRRAMLADRYCAAHILWPVRQQLADAFFTNGDDETLQRAWAAENGLPAGSSLTEILLGQLENHRTEVFYNLDPMRYGSDFIRRLPGCVRHKLAWRAAPSPGADFAAYDRILCNFPAILAGYRERGWRGAYLEPAHDPAMDGYASNEDRPVDVLFVGGYSRHHRRRAAILESVAGLSPAVTVRYHLDKSRLTRLAESPLGRVLPLSAHRRARSIRDVSAEPVFGLGLYEAISRARIVLNCAIDMAGEERGNMRCFEAMGCGALLVSDAGRYPPGMSNGISMLTYADASQAREIVATSLSDPGQARELARNGHRVVSTEFSSSTQWQEFQKIVGAI